MDSTSARTYSPDTKIDFPRPRRSRLSGLTDSVHPAPLGVNHESERVSTAMSPSAGLPLPKFNPVTADDMPTILPYLMMEEGRTTDFSYGGLFMWVNYFHYEFAIVADTLFIKGRLEDDRTRVAFSLPIGKLDLETSVDLLKRYCEHEGIELLFSAVPESALEKFKALKPNEITESEDWADYLYDAGQLAWLKGKKMAKKRNHVNHFEATYPGFVFESMTASNAAEAMAFMDEFDKEGDDNSSARAERLMTRRLIAHFSQHPDAMEGALLKVDGNVCGFTIGDVKDDTLFVHIEKCTRRIEGSYEAINAYFVRYILDKYPDVEFVNREDDAGDEGLRLAKQSYHPLKMLRKFNVEFVSNNA